MRRRTLVGVASTAILCSGTLAAALGSQAASASSAARSALAGTAAPAAAKAHPVGSVSPSSLVSFALVLKLRDLSGAQALVQAVSTPGSASYRHYLTAAQWEARFSPTAADVAQASNWLRSEGFAVGAVAKDRMTITASGTAAQVESAFGTSLENYRVAGHTLRMAIGNLSVPASLAGAVAGALGINEHLATPATAGNPDIPGSSTASGTSSSSKFPAPPSAFVPSPPCGAYYGAATTTLHPPFGQGYPNTVPDVVCGYKPAQLRSAYGVTASGATGKGATVAVVDAYGSATIGLDATQYSAANDPGNPFSKAHFRQIDQTPFANEALCAAGSWETEQAIDVESVHGMAPDAHILYVGAADCFDTSLFAAEQTVIDGGLANVVTNSWADLAGDLLVDASTKTAFDNLFLMAAGTGIGIQFSSGDDGDNFYVTGFSAANYPSSSPLVTAVGGTSLKIGGAGQRIGELGWATGRSFLCTANVVNILCPPNALNTWLPARPDGISGGFTSYYYLQPSYQAPVVPTALSERNAGIFGPVPLRVVPDISAVADPGTGFLIGLHETFPGGGGQVRYGETRYGGTSLASPVLAGIIADADQAAGASLGFINPAIYAMDVAKPPTILDILPEKTLQGNYRADHAGDLGLGLPTKGAAVSFRELFYGGLETYCDPTGNCASRPQPLTAAPGYDGLTGLGSPGTNFITSLGNF